MLTIRTRPEGFDRLRTMMQALVITDNEKRGPLLREMDATHRRQTRAAFTTQGASTGTPWVPLSRRYAAWKRQVRPGKRILVFDGEMRDGHTQASDPSHIRRFIRPFTYAFGIASEKAWRHENGIGVPNQKLPRRSVLQKTAADLRGFVETLVSYYVKRMKQATRHL